MQHGHCETESGEENGAAHNVFRGVLVTVKLVSHFICYLQEQPKKS